MNKLVIGILAHVDAGKTTLSESILYTCGKIRKLGRVDNKDAYLDTYALEKQRGITIFSKQAVFETGDMQITLLDTPGHVDFSAETERTLSVLDYAVLVVSGADGVQGHTKTLWRLLDIYKIPAFIFVNKMDQNGTDREKLLKDIKKQLDDGCVDFSADGKESFCEELCLCDEKIMDAYLETGNIETGLIKKAVATRKVFPCFFGSALKLQGVEAFIRSIEKYAEIPRYPEKFGAKIFKITRDERGQRLTHLKITGGRIKVKDILSNGEWDEKVNQIRIYSGEKYEAVNEADAGSVCAVTGLSKAAPGEGIGIEGNSGKPVLEPVLSYKIELPEGCDKRTMLPKLRQIEEEQPEFHIVFDEQLQEIHAQIMGEVQLEILQSLIKNRFGVEVFFGEGNIIYKETIANTVEGVGHFEPLRHYAEVHLLLEPGKRGSSLRFCSACSEDVLSKSWQRLILTHLAEKRHKGVLTGSQITDIKITLVSGRAHPKHTEGGDFREATYRAVRQGLMEAKSILLEPYYSFQIELPEKMVGKAMNDVEKMHGTCEISRTNGEAAVLSGSAPVASMRNYQKDLAAYTKGLGRIFCSLKGYEPCRNQQEVIENIGYDCERDTGNPAGSVFCAHGAGFLVDWDDVKKYMHVESFLKPEENFGGGEQKVRTGSQEKLISVDEIDRIIKRTSFANEGKKTSGKSHKTARQSYYEPSDYVSAPREIKDEYLLVDGYNIIFAWPDLSELAALNMDGARMKLIETLSGYRAIKKCRIILVFDAYRVKGHTEETLDIHNIHVVFTKEAQTADQYIERFTHGNKTKYSMTVATSDGLQQIIVRGAGCFLLSARELKAEIERAEKPLKAECEKTEGLSGGHIKDRLTPETKKQMEKLMRDDTSSEKI